MAFRAAQPRRCAMIYIKMDTMVKFARRGSYPLAQPDRRAAPGADDRREQPVARRLLRLAGECRVAVLDLLAAESLDRVAQRRLVVAQLGDLARVVRVDRLLHRHRAG